MRKYHYSIIVSIVLAVLLVVNAGGVFAGDDTDELKDKQEKIEKKLKKTEKSLLNDKQELNTIVHSINTVQYRMTMTQKEIDALNAEIRRREQGIDDLTTQVAFQKNVLAAILRELYRNSKTEEVTEVLGTSQFSQMFGARDHLSALRLRASEQIAKIVSTKERMEKEKKELSEKNAQKRELLAIHKNQQNLLATEKNRKVSEIHRKEATISELNAKLSAVKNSLSRLLGKSFSTDDIVKAAKLASKHTGVRKDFILGELVVETNLGKFTGGCTYKKANMTSANKTAFKSITKSLGYKYKKLKVSCAPGYGHGGAMGVAQFMPTTWLGYQSRIATATGNNPPDPWNLVDGVTAMALYLKDKGAGHKSGEFLASKRYFCGSPASRYWNTKCNDYANNVRYWAKNYERLIK